MKDSAIIKIVSVGSATESKQTF